MSIKKSEKELRDMRINNKNIRKMYNHIGDQNKAKFFSLLQLRKSYENLQHESHFNVQSLQQILR